MRTRKGLMFTIFTDILLTLVAVLMVLWQSSAQQAVARREEIDGLSKEVGGLRGVLVETTEKLTKSQHHGNELQSIVEGQDLRIGELTETVGLLTYDNGVLSSRIRSGDPVTLLVMIDVSQSMTEPIKELRSSLGALFEQLPNTSKDFRVGGLAFRRGVVSRFPITPIVPTYEDDGRSQTAALAFVESLRAEGGYTDHLPVFREAVAMLAKAHPKPEAELKQRIIFLGDVGPSELDGKPGFNAQERATKDRILSAVTKWAKVGNRAVASLYTESEFSAKDPSSAESRQWFEALGRVSPPSAFYSDTSSLLRAVLHATRE